MTVTNLKKVVEGLKKFVHDAALDLQYRVRKEDFTRERLLPFHRVVSIILSAMKRPLDLELKVVFDLVDVLACPTDSALCQARKKLLSVFFVHWLERQSELVYACPHETFMGFRLIAVDGSMAFLPDNPAMRKAFPPVVNKGDPMQARILCWYDVLNQHAVQTRLGPSSLTEIDMAFDGLDCFGKGDILVYDRHFPGWGLIRMHQLREVPFVMRCKVSFNNAVKAFVKSGELDKVVQFTLRKKSVDRLTGMGVAAKAGARLTVRLIRVDIGGDEPEVLATSLLDTEKFPHAVFGDLYFRRWGVETFFDRLKNKFQLQVFSGKTVESVKQDFFATIFLANLQSMMARAIQPDVTQATEGRKHQYQVNWNKNLGLLKPMVTTLFGRADAAEALENLLEEMALPRYCEPVRKGRTVRRSKKRKQLRTKHCHWPNMKRAM
jgi:hypothetical protein